MIGCSCPPVARRSESSAFPSRLAGCRRGRRGGRSSAGTTSACSGRSFSSASATRTSGRSRCGGGRSQSRESRCARDGAVSSSRRGAVRVRDGDVEIAIELDEREPVETATAYGRTFAWTAKQADVPARGMVRPGGRDDRGGFAGGRGRKRRLPPAPHNVEVERGGREADRRAQRRLEPGHAVSTILRARASERSGWRGSRRRSGPSSSPPTWARSAFEDGASVGFTEWVSREDRTNALLMRSLLPAAVRNLRGRALGWPGPRGGLRRDGRARGVVVTPHEP